ncbi:MAG: hypothetical protein V3V99_07510 [candidate division Zixibacteria bacterium]
MYRLLFVVMIFILIGCGGEEQANRQEETIPKTNTEAQTDTEQETAPPLAGVDLMPLEVGNSWVYELAAMDTLTGELTVNKIDTFRVERDTVIDGETFYFISGMGLRGTLATNRDDGFWIMGPMGQPIMLAKFPGVDGEDFSMTVGPSVITNRLDKAGLEIEVPAGKFYCYKYSQVMGPMRRTTYNYFAPGLGLVKMETLGSPTGKPIMVGRLIDYAAQ